MKLTFVMRNRTLSLKCMKIIKDIFLNFCRNMFSTGGKLLVLRFTFNSSFYMQVSVSIDMIEDERAQGMRTEKI